MDTQKTRERERERETERDREREFYSQLHCRHTRRAISPSKLVPILSNTYNERYTKENIHTHTHTHTLFKNTQQTCMNKMQMTITKEKKITTHT